METIKKYENRKLYSTATKGYVNLEYLIEQIRDGNQVEVLTYKSGKNVTNETLKEALKVVNLDTTLLFGLIKGEYGNENSLPTT